jgi:hypothetical protein
MRFAELQLRTLHIKIYTPSVKSIEIEIGRGTEI